MAGRGPQTFKKRQKEQARKEKQQEKIARRLQRRHDKNNGVENPDHSDTSDLLAPQPEGQKDDQISSAQPAELQS
jgi:hypothetical protein